MGGLEKTAEAEVQVHRLALKMGRRTWATSRSSKRLAEAAWPCWVFRMAE